MTTVPTAIAATAVRAPSSCSRRIRRSAMIPSTTPTGATSTDRASATGASGTVRSGSVA